MAFESLKHLTIPQAVASVVGLVSARVYESRL